MMEFSLGRYFADQPPPDLLFNAHPQPGGAYGQPIAPLSHGFHYDMDVPLPPSPQHPPSNTNRPVDHQHWKEHTLSSDTGISMTAPGAGSLSRVACTECRSRHLKCDAKTPRCSRCCDTGSICIYKKSRRGWKGPRRKDRPSSQEVRKPGQPLAVDLTHNFGTATHDISNNLVGQCRITTLKRNRSVLYQSIEKELTVHDPPSSPQSVSHNYTYSRYFTKLPGAFNFIFIAYNTTRGGRFDTSRPFRLVLRTFPFGAPDSATSSRAQ